MAYTVDPDNENSPLDNDFPASNVTLELRLLKAKINQMQQDIIDNIFPAGMIIGF